MSERATSDVVSLIALALVDSLLFFELCEDSVLDPDVALRMSETILGRLDGCSAEEFAIFMQAVHFRLTQEQAGSKRPDVMKYLATFDRGMLPQL